MVVQHNPLTYQETEPTFTFLQDISTLNLNAYYSIVDN